MMDFIQMVRDNCPSVMHQRIKVVQWGELKLDNCGLCVLFLFAPWSAACMLSFRLLCDAFQKDPKVQLEIVVLNLDEMNYDRVKSLVGDLPQGKGETIWVKCGTVVLRDRGYTFETANILQKRIASLMSSEPI